MQTEALSTEGVFLAGLNIYRAETVSSLLDIVTVLNC